MVKNLSAGIVLYSCKSFFFYIHRPSSETSHTGYERETCISQYKCGIKYNWLLLNTPQLPTHPSFHPPTPSLPLWNSHPPHPIEHPLLSDRGRDGLRRHSRSILQREGERKGGRGGSRERRWKKEGEEETKKKKKKRKREERRGGQNAEWLQSYRGSSSGWRRSLETSIFVNCIVPSENKSIPAAVHPSIFVQVLYFNTFITANYSPHNQPVFNIPSLKRELIVYCMRSFSPAPSLSPLVTGAHTHTHKHADARQYHMPLCVCVQSWVLSASTEYRSHHSPPCSQLLSYIACPVWFLP